MVRRKRKITREQERGVETTGIMTGMSIGAGSAVVALAPIGAPAVVLGAGAVGLAAGGVAGLAAGKKIVKRLRRKRRLQSR